MDSGVKSFPIHDDPEYELLESHHEAEEMKTGGF